MKLGLAPTGRLPAADGVGDDAWATDAGAGDPTAFEGGGNPEGEGDPTETGEGAPAVREAAAEGDTAPAGEPPTCAALGVEDTAGNGTAAADEAATPPAEFTAPPLPAGLLPPACLFSRIDRQSKPPSEVVGIDVALAKMIGPRAPLPKSKGKRE